MNPEQYMAHLIEQDRIRPCPKCHTTDGLRIILMTEGMHHGKIVCDNCNQRFHTWAPKPDRPTKRSSKTTGLLNTIRDTWQDEPLYCQICLRDERTLPQGVWMEAHHILEHQDAGTDHPANLWPVCNECHTLIHWRRKTVHGERVGKTEESEHAPS